MSRESDVLDYLSERIPETENPETKKAVDGFIRLKRIGRITLCPAVEMGVQGFNPILCSRAINTYVGIRRNAPGTQAGNEVLYSVITAQRHAQFHKASTYMLRLSRLNPDDEEEKTKMELEPRPKMSKLLENDFKSNIRVASHEKSFVSSIAEHILHRILTLFVRRMSLMSLSGAQKKC